MAMVCRMQYVLFSDIVRLCSACQGGHSGRLKIIREGIKTAIEETSGALQVILSCHPMHRCRLRAPASPTSIPHLTPHHASHTSHLDMCVYIYIYMHTHTHTHTYIRYCMINVYIYIYTYIYIYREREMMILLP